MYISKPVDLEKKNNDSVGNKSPRQLDFTMSPATQGNTEYSYAVGSSATAKSKEVQGRIVICGKETITASASAFPLKARADGSKLTKETGVDTYSTWFEITPGAESHQGCGVGMSYRLLKEAKPDSELSDSSAALALTGDKLILTIAKLTDTPVKVYLEATTLGGQVAYKTIEVSKSQDPCSYTVTPLTNPTIVLPYKLGTDVNPIELFKTKGNMVFASDPVDAVTCPLDKLSVYQSDKGATLKGTKDVTHDSLKFTMEEENKGKNFYYFKIGGTGGQSPLATGRLVICGKETITVAKAKLEAKLTQDG